MFQDKEDKATEPQTKGSMLVVPDRYSERDLIGYSAYGAGLVEMVRSVQSDGSFTIGVFGQWGQGKTSMLRQIKHALDDDENILTVWFNPWQFSKEEHIIVPFFHTLVSFLKEYKEKHETLGSKIAPKLKRFWKELVRVPIALSYGLETDIKIPILLKTKFKPKEIIEESRRQRKEIEKKAKSEDEKIQEDYESLYYRLISRLEAASKELDLKIVVFIDDLDRCLPEKAVELLEGIKVLLDIPGFVFVLGVAREVIERGIRVLYHSLYTDLPKDRIFLEEEYLDKIIQFPFTLPAPDLKLLRKLVGDYLKGVPEVDPYLPIIHQALGNNPRCLKRFINNLSYTFWVAREKKIESGDKEEFHACLLVKMTLISFRFPRLYHIIGKTPSHLLRIQKFLQVKPELDKLKRTGELTDEEQRKMLVQNNVQHPDDFIEIKHLELFEHPNVHAITSILCNCVPAENDEEPMEALNFEDEEEVLKYVSLLTATTKTEETSQISGNTIRDTIAQRMIKIPAGSVSLMDAESGNQYTAVVKEFWLDKYPVTQRLYHEITNQFPSNFKGDDLPVERVSWLDAVKFCNLLSDNAGLPRAYEVSGDNVTPISSSNGFRLPTESEWEYACRAGSTGYRYNDLDSIAWYNKNSGGQTRSVGQKLPNDWGLYDMLGNVWEWCWDWFGPYPKDKEAVWSGPDSGEYRVLRGGSWINNDENCRSSFRRRGHPADRFNGAGFRIARSL